MIIFWFKIWLSCQRAGQEQRLLDGMHRRRFGASPLWTAAQRLGRTNAVNIMQDAVLTSQMDQVGIVTAIAFARVTVWPRRKS